MFIVAIAGLNCGTEICSPDGNGDGRGQGIFGGVVVGNVGRGMYSGDAVGVGSGIFYRTTFLLGGEDVGAELKSSNCLRLRSPSICQI